jgi:adenylate kinase family enzyme
MKRILILGCAGSGKSTLAKALAQKLQLPIVHLDHFHWLPGRIRRTDEAFTKLLMDTCKQDAWIMDGTYLRHLARRLPFADTIIFIDTARWLCLWRIAKRWLRSFFTHEEFAPGCKNTINGEFLLWVWQWHARYRQPTLAMITYAGKANVIILRTNKEISSFLEQVQRP